MDKLIRELANIVEEDDILYGTHALAVFSADASPFIGKALAVVRPESLEEVVEIVKVANRYKVRLYPRGAGTGTKGGVVPFEGIVVDMKKMNRVEVFEDDMICKAESGAVISKIKEKCLDKNLFLPPEPGSSEVATIGGFVAVGGSGKRALKYGTIANYVSGVEAVLPNGDVVSFSNRTHKYPPLPQSVFVGSEGAFGIIVSVTLRLLPAPETRRTLVAEFESFEDAFKKSREVIKLLPDCVEYSDEKVAEKLGYSGHVVAVEDFFENEKLERALGSFEELRGKDEERFWKVRGSVGSISSDGKKRFYLADDFAVPFSRAVEFEKAVREAERECGVDVYLYAHLDTCNFHPAVVTDSLESALKFEEALEKRAFSLGAVFGEHGVGLKNLKTFEHLRRLKKCLDEQNIMNPGKIFS